MKNVVIKYLLICFILIVSVKAHAQLTPNSQLQDNPWTTAQLMSPANLAAMIKAGKKVRLYNIGVVDNIPGAISMGGVSEKQNLTKFKEAIKPLPKEEQIIIYCGCCPFDRCPNIRPAFTALKQAKFLKPMLLNLPTNLRTDWVGKGYPVK